MHRPTLAASSNVWPPTPDGGHAVLGHLLEYRRDPLSFFTSCARKQGDIVFVKIANYAFFLVSHPDYVEQLLVKHHDKLKKDRMLRSRSSRELFGDGLLVSSGDKWRRHRQLAQPAFRADRMDRYAKIISSRVEAMFSRWGGGGVYDIHAEMKRLILEISGQAFFGIDIADDADRVARALIPVAEQFSAQGSVLALLRRILPTPGRFRYRQALAMLDRIVFDIVRQRRVNAEEQEDLLSMLTRSSGDGGQQLTEQEVRDEVMTFFLAGHETTALALSWTLLLLALNSEARQQAAEEALLAPGETPPWNRRAPYLDAVVKESLRLYPPVWTIARAATAPFKLGGFDVPTGMQLVISQWVLHRDPRFFNDPYRFDPTRWLSGGKIGPRYAYLPFGAGPRACIGQSLATLECAIVIDSILQRFEFVLAPENRVIKAVAGITLRPDNGIFLMVERRSYERAAGFV